MTTRESRKDCEPTWIIVERPGYLGKSKDEQEAYNPHAYYDRPGRIPAAYPEMIPNIVLENSWWQPGSIEELYQKAKVLQIRK